MSAPFVRLADVKPEPVTALWEGRITCGTVTLLEADPGTGKSTIAYDIAARVTAGRPMPQCDAATVPASGVVLVGSEDSVSRVMRPRLHVAGADLGRVLATGGRLRLPQDIGVIEDAVLACRARLVVIDPFSDFLDGDSRNEKHVRAAIGALAALATRRQLAVLIVRHQTKAGGSRSIARGMGSIGISASARSILTISRDPVADDPYRHILAQTKSNLSSRAPSLSYRTVLRDGEVAIEWLGVSPSAPTDDINHAALAQAMRVLHTLLAAGPMWADECHKAAAKAGVAKRTLERAKQALRVGTIVHAAIDRIAKSSRASLERLMVGNGPEELLRQSCLAEGLNDLALGDAWTAAVQTLKRSLRILEDLPDSERGAHEGAQHASGSPTRRSSNPEPFDGHSRKVSWVAREATEAYLIDTELGVKGKCDLRVVQDDVVRIDDFKIGRAGGDPERLEKWRKQVTIYALVSWRVTGRKRHVGRVVAADGIYDVDLGDAVFERLTNELLDLKKSWAEQPTHACDLFALGPDCRQCTVRHVCPGYLSCKPWAPGGDLHDDPDSIWSWDVWGGLSRVSTVGNSIVIAADDGTRVIVNNVPALPTNLAIGDRIGLFGLQKAKGYSVEHPRLRFPPPAPGTKPPRWFKSLS